MEWGMMLFTAAIAFASVAYTWYTKELVRQQFRANVMIYTLHDPDTPGLIKIRIENRGSEVARDIRFKTQRPIPHRAFGWDGSTEQVEEMRQGPLVDGIGFLAPGSARVIAWGQFGGLRAALNGAAIPIEVTWKSEDLKRTFKAQSVLEYESFEGTEQARSVGHNIEASIKDVGKHLSTIAISLDKKHP